MGDGKGKGILAVIIMLIGGALLVVGPKEGVIASILHLAGLLGVIAGVGIFALVAALMFAAMAAKKKDPDAEDKMEINRFMEERRQELAKFKSTVATTEFELRKVEQSIADTERQIRYAESDAKAFVLKGDDYEAKRMLIRKQQLEKTRERLIMTRDGYENALAEMHRLVDKLESDIVSLESRLTNANALNSINSTDDRLIKEYEEKAQYQADYQEALRELESGMTAEMAKYAKEDTGSFAKTGKISKEEELSIDEKLAQLKKDQQNGL